MRTVLTALPGRCTSLKSLVLNEFGLEISDDQSRNRPEEMHASVYAEYSDFLTSVIGHLEEFRFEQGVPAGDVNGRPRDRLPGSVYQAIRPLDQDFLTYILPVILAGGWSRLRHIELRGIGRGHDHPALSEATEAQIQDGLGPNLMCFIEEDARPMWPCLGMDAGFNREDLKEFEVPDLID